MTPDLFTHESLDEWRALFHRATWTRSDGAQFPGYVCPDPECGQTAPSKHGMLIEHGMDPDVPDWRRGTWCAHIDRHRRRWERGLPTLDTAPDQFDTTENNQ